MNQQNVKSKSNIGAIFLSLVGFIIIYNLFAQTVIGSSMDIQNELNSIINSSSVKIKQIAMLVIVISSFLALATVGIYFVINKLILYKLKVKSISSSKLLLSILISSSVGPVIQILVLKLGIINPSSTLLSVITSLSLPLLMSFLLKDYFKNKKQFYIYFISLIVLATLNILLKFS